MTRETEGETASQSRLASRESEKVIEAAKSSVTSTETLITKEEDEQAAEAGSVWKVARADASPGEIQKLKLCRQRNMSETSDASSSRKRSSKWHEGSEGITEEIDSSDERATVGSSKTTVDDAPRTEENTSVVQGRDSSEEVSDSKEFPPEIATAELSDVKPNIDYVDQGETSETTIVINANERQDDKPSEVIPAPSSGELKSSVNENPDGDKHDDEQIPKEVKKDKQAEDQKEKEDKENENVEDRKDSKVDVVPNDQVKVEPCSENEDQPSLEENVKTTDDNADPRDSKESSSDENDQKNKKHLEVGPIERERRDTSEDNSEDDNKKEKATKAPLPRTTSRRKHRDKYRDSSNSDTGESEDESERDKRSKRDVIEESRTNRDRSPKIEESNHDKDSSRKTEIRAETPACNETPADSDRPIVENDKPKANEDNERHEQISAANATVVQLQTNYKPAKVNLKRSL